MYKILLVDDEYFPREALKASIPWEEYGCTVCGEAKNGFDGIEKAMELKPDIILTDINMPFMDGLDMIMNLQKEQPRILYSIVTGYSEFEYARRGMELGVHHFIVKPIDDKEMIKTIQNMVEILDENHKKEREYESLKFWAEKNSEENRKNFLDMLLMEEGGISESQFLFECEQLNLPMKQGGYIVSCLKIDSRTYVHLSQEEWQKKVAQMLGNMREGWNFTVYYQGYGNLFIIFSNLTETDRMRNVASELLQSMQIAMMQEWVCTVMAGIGRYCKTYHEIVKSREEAEASIKEITVSKLITEMLRYIHENYMNPDLSLKEIAEKLFVNYSYLSTQFKKEMGMSASQYILRFRMTKAADAFRSGKENMVEVAGIVGYVDTKYFYRCFKKEFGITPNQYIEVLQKTRSSGEVF